MLPDCTCGTLMQERGAWRENCPRAGDHAKARERLHTPPLAPTHPNVGDPVRVIKDVLSARAGREGTVLELYDDGVTIDFFECFCGAKSCPCYTSIEFWKFTELERTW